MSWENALLMKLSNDVEKYEIEVTKMGQNFSDSELKKHVVAVIC